MTDEPTIAEVWAACRAIAELPRPGTPLTPTVMPVAETLTQAHFRAECEQRAVMTMVGNSPVAVYPIGTRPA